MPLALLSIPNYSLSTYPSYNLPLRSLLINEDGHKQQKPLVISRVVVDLELCIGAAPCVTVAPGVFQLDEENKAYVVDPNGADAETILLAAQACPTQAIILYDEDGNQIYPEA